MIKAGCTGKRVFASFAQGKKAAERLRREHEEAHVEAYHCRVCNGVHVGENRDYGQRDARRKPESEAE